jgi:hypothetical protein
MAARVTWRSGSPKDAAAWEAAINGWYGGKAGRVEIAQKQDRWRVETAQIWGGGPTVESHPNRDVREEVTALLRERGFPVD